MYREPIYRKPIYRDPIYFSRRGTSAGEVSGACAHAHRVCHVLGYITRGASWKAASWKAAYSKLRAGDKLQAVKGVKNHVGNWSRDRNGRTCEFGFCACLMVHYSNTWRDPYRNSNRLAHTSEGE